MDNRSARHSDASELSRYAANDRDLRIAPAVFAPSIWADESEGGTPNVKRRWLDAGKNPRQSSAIQTSDKAGTVTVSGRPVIDVPPGILDSILKRAALK